MTAQIGAADNSVKTISYWHLIKGSVPQWIEDEPFPLAAALSYYTLFSLAPLIIIAIAVASFAFKADRFFPLLTHQQYIIILQ